MRRRVEQFEMLNPGISREQAKNEITEQVIHELATATEEDPILRNLISP
jgi:hypothetical protein